MTKYKAVLLALMTRYLRGLLDPFISLLEAHKLMYFMKITGEDSLQKTLFVKGPHGPYSAELRHTFNEIKGYLTLGYMGGGNMPDKQFEMLPGTAKKADEYISQYPDTRDKIDRVAELIDGFETSSGLELLSTVHWAAHEDNPQTMDELVKSVYRWNPRKKQFSESEVRLAAEQLVSCGWWNGFGPAVPPGSLPA